MILSKRAFCLSAIFLFFFAQVKSKSEEEKTIDHRSRSGVQLISKSSCGSMALPYGAELVQFKGEALVDGNVLSWITASEKLDLSYTIERSMDGVSYMTVGQTQSSGSADYVHMYSLIDKTESNEPVYYRLRQSTGSGLDMYSDEIVINRSEQMGLTHFQINTEDESGALDIEYDQLYKERVIINFYDANGHRVIHKSLPGIDGHNMHRVDLSSLDIGMYEFDISRKQGGLLYKSSLVKNN